MNSYTSQRSLPTVQGPVEDYAGLMARLAPKVRAAMEKHLGICEADAALGYGRVWKRLAEFMGRLASHAVEVSGPAFRFFILDGKYRRQVFALEDSRQGTLRIYLPDIVAAAQARKLLGASTTRSYPVGGEMGRTIHLEEFTADSKDIPEFCKPMLGWGRRAVRTELSATAEEKEIRTIEKLCLLAAEGWATPVAPAEPGPVAT